MGLIKMNGVNYWGSAYGQGIIAPMIYSEEEIEVGVWTDSKPLYQKVYTGSIGTSNVDIALDPNVDVVIMDCGHSFKVQTGSSNIVYLGFYNSSTDRFQAYYRNANKDIRVMSVGSTYAGDFCLTVLYTKTTDTAGSGTYTSSKALAVHYSTNEQVIGTWINSKPLYQRTIEQSSTNVSGTEVQVDLSSWNIDECVEVSGFFDRVAGGNKSTYYFNSREFGASNEYWGFAKYHNANKYLAFSIKLTSSTTSKQVITLLYTKTTD